MSQQILSRAILSGYQFYGYEPSKVVAGISAAIFAIAFAWHLFLAIRFKNKYVWWAFTVGVLMEAIGYGTRVSSAANPTKLMSYLIQNLFVVLAPAFLAASLYMTFGRLMMQVGDEYSYIRRTWVTKTFVTFDILSFLVQSGGGGIYAKADKPSTVNLARGILVAGFIIQIVAFSVFIILSVLYQTRARRAGVPKGGWTKALWTMYAASVLILVRSVFRMIEFAQGNVQTSSLQQHEAYFYLLEALPIAITVYLLALSYPERWLSSDREMLCDMKEIPLKSTDSSYA